LVKFSDLPPGGTTLIYGYGIDRPPSGWWINFGESELVVWTTLANKDKIARAFLDRLLLTEDELAKLLKMMAFL
jgi:hypothetical protein